MFKAETGNEVLRRARLAVGILVGAVVGRTRRARATIEMALRQSARLCGSESSLRFV
jgi:hypothetical protein